MEPAGKRAGTASALYGSVTAMGGAVLGSAIGLTFDNSVVPPSGGHGRAGAWRADRGLYHGEKG